MAVRVKVTADTQQADKAIKQSQEQAAKGYEKLERLAEEGLKSEKLKSAFEGLKKVTAFIGPDLDMISKGLGENIKGAFELAEGGAKIGSAFGPIGTIVGGGLGAMLGYFLSAKRQAEELRKQLRELQTAAADSRAKLLEMDDVTISAVSAEIDKFRDKIFGVGRDAEAARNAVKGLLGIGAEGLLEAADAALESTSGLKQATLDILQPKTLGVDEAKEELNKYAKLVKFTRGQIEDEQKLLRENIAKGNNDEATLKSQEKLLNTLKERLKEYSKAQLEAAGAIRKAIDKDLKDEEDARKKAADAQRAREEKQFAAWMKEREARQKEEDKVTKAIADRENRWYQEAQAAKKWSDDIKKFTEEVAQSQSELNDLVKKWDEERKEREAKDLEEKKQKLQESFDQQKDAFEAALQPFADVASSVFSKIQENIEAGKRPLEGFKQAFRSAVGEALKSLGKQWGAQSLSELAAGFAALALGPVGGVTAGQHFTAAALYGSAAVAAGLGGAAASKSAAPPAASSSSAPPAASSGSGSSNPSLGKSSSGSSGGGTILVTLSNNMFLEGNDRVIARAGAIIGNAIGASNTATFLDTGAKRAA